MKNLLYSKKESPPHYPLPPHPLPPLAFADISCASSSWRRAFDMLQTKRYAKKQNIFKFRLSPVLEPSLNLSLAQSQGSGKFDPLWSWKITLGRKPTKWIPHQSGFSLLIILFFDWNWLFDCLMSPPSFQSSKLTIAKNSPGLLRTFQFFKNKHNNEVLSWLHCFCDKHRQCVIKR